MSADSKLPHEIAIIVKGVPTPGAFPASPLPDLVVNDTVRYSSPHGTVSIDFPDLSPYRDDDLTGTTVKDGEINTVLRDGTFMGRCSIELPDGTVVGWSKDSPASGVEIRIPKPAPQA